MTVKETKHLLHTVVDWLVRLNAWSSVGGIVWGRLSDLWDVVLAGGSK